MGKYYCTETIPYESEVKKMFLLTMTVIMYAVTLGLLISDDGSMTDYEIRQTLKEAHLVY